MSTAVKYVMLTLLLVGSAFAATSWTLNVGSRVAIIYAPDNLNKPALVIGMHGMYGNPWWSQGAMQYEKIADTANFVVAYPGSDGDFWDIDGDKDVNFILAIIDSMSNRYQIDRNRVYASGFSMGGMMSWHLSCKIPDKIAAIVGGDGYPMGGMSGCSEVRHVPALQIHGTSDKFVSYSGFVGSFLPAQISRYGCPTNAVKTSPYPVGINGRNASQLAQPSKSFMEYYGPCEKDGLKSELALISVDGMIHDWATPDKANTNDVDPGYLGLPLDVNGTWEAWNWLKTHSLVGDIPVIPVVTVPAHRDTVYNGGFNQAALGWKLNTWGGTAQGSVVNGEFAISISALGTANSSIQLVQNGIILQQGKSYEVQFDAYASANRTLEANVEQDISPWTSYLPALESFNLTTTKTAYSYTFTMTNATDSNGRVSFNAGASTIGLFLDNISIKEVMAPTPTSVRDIIAKNGLVSVSRSGSHLEIAVNAMQNTSLSMGLYNLVGTPVRLSPRIIDKAQASWTADLAGLPNGIYFVKVNSDGRILHSSKLVVGR